MKNMKLIGLSIIIFSSSFLLADKPEWAGNGGKPSEYEKEYHKDKMRSKYEDKKYKKQKKYKKEKHYKNYDDNYIDYDKNRDSRYESHKKTYNGRYYEGQGQSDGEFIEQKVDETKKNWMGKFFDFLN